ncbi:MAG: hypothetical protein LCH95_09995 [Proteobacteria bacterium]|nr:hypothetical protein [Pseudomonadota bacterium]
MTERPDLAALSDAEKDALIRALWRAQAADRAELRRLRRRLDAPGDGAAAAAASPLLDRLREADPRPRRPSPVEVEDGLGRGFRPWRSTLLMGAIGLLCAGFAIDGAVGIWQSRDLQRQRQARLLLEHEARSALYVELKRIVAEPDGKSFRMTLSLQNTNPAAPLFVMLNAVGVFVQVGTAWQQVPSRALGVAGSGVVRLVDGYTWEVAFTPDVTGWAELIPGYMHVRVQADLLIGRQAQPGRDIVERRTPFYVYLKPHGADDAAIRARTNMSGPPPLFIPMPPH